MADRKITELAALSAGGQATGDLLTIVDVSESAAADKNKKITVESLFKGIPSNVGIGTTSPTTPLQVHSSATASTIRITNSTSGVTSSDGLIIQESGNDAYIWNKENSFISLGTNNTEQVRIDNSGRLLVGTASVVDSGATSSLQVVNTSTAIIALGRNDSSISAGNDLGAIRFYGNDGGSYQQCAEIVAEADGDHANNDKPTRLVFSTTADGASSPTERMRIDSSGKVGIGTTSPEDPLHIKSNSGAIRLENTVVSNNDSIISYDNATLLFQCDVNNVRGDSTILFKSDDQDRLTIDGNGDVGIGTTSPQGELHLHARDTNGFLRITNTTTGSTSGDGALFQMNGNNLNINNLESGNFVFHTADSEAMRIDSSQRLLLGLTSNGGGKLQVNGGIRVAGSGSHTDASSPYLYRTSGADNLCISTSSTERMRVTSNGEILINKTGKQATEIFGFTFGAGSQGCNSVVGVTSTQFHFVFTNSNGAVGSISTNGSATTFSTSSDYRLKENVVDLDDAITRVKQLSPKRFNFIADADTTVDGFVAHEAQTVVPEAVTGAHNEVDDDGNAVMQGIDQSKLVPLLTAALKEAIAKIETLETKVAALEAQ